MSDKMADTSSGHKSTTLRFGYVCHFMKPGDFEDIPVSRILQFAQRVGLLNAWAKGLHKKIGKGRGAWVTAEPALL